MLFYSSGVECSHVRACKRDFSYSRALLITCCFPIALSQTVYNSWRKHLM